MSGLIGLAVLVAVVVIFLGPRRNSETSSPGYDLQRELNDPGGWHFVPYGREWLDKRRARKAKVVEGLDFDKGRIIRGDEKGDR